MKKTYKVGDKIEFKIRDKIYYYSILSRYLRGIDTKNAIIFNALGITEEEEREKYCEDIYGYTPNRGGFPEYDKNDLIAINAIIKKLKKDCNKINIEEGYYEYIEEGYYEYKVGDEVIFILQGVKYKYTINASHFIHQDSDENSIIFIKLEIYNNKASFCTQAYGYPSKSSGSFPNYKINDVVAINSVIKKLKKACKEFDKLKLKTVGEIEYSASEIKDKIKQMYPVGTIIIPLTGSGEKTTTQWTINKSTFKNINLNEKDNAYGDIIVYEAWGEDHHGYLYSHNKFAPIVGDILSISPSISIIEFDDAIITVKGKVKSRITIVD